MQISGCSPRARALTPQGQAIEHVARSRAACALDEPAVVADALTTAFLRFEQQTARMVGEAGYHALKQRALYLTRSDLKSHPALTSIDLTPLLDQSWDLAVLQLGKLAACQCASALLAQVLGLLNSFIGEDLTVRIVRRAWTELDLTALVPLRGES
jgi:hypothetical protein